MLDADARDTNLTHLFFQASNAAKGNNILRFQKPRDMVLLGLMSNHGQFSLMQSQVTRETNNRDS